MICYIKMGNNKRKIAVVIASRANYGRAKSLLQEIKNRKDLELQIIVSASRLENTEMFQN